MNLRSSIKQLTERVHEVAKLREQAAEIHLEQMPDGYYRIGKRYLKLYPKTKEYLESTVRFPCLVGPMGSGKTSVSVVKLLVDNARYVPVQKDGVVRAKSIITRNTYGMLESTTLKSLEYWMQDIPLVFSRRKAPLEFKYRLNFKIDGKVGVLENSFSLLALDKPGDYTKLLSYEPTNGWINEISEFPQSLKDFISLRLGRYPNAQDFKEPLPTDPDKRRFIQQRYCRLLSDSNPWPDDSWQAKTYEYQANENHKCIRQPPGLLRDESAKKWLTNPDAENIDNLASGYYEAMTDAPLERIKVYALGQNGVWIDGDVVYEQYSDDMHAELELDILPGVDVYAGWDVGWSAGLVFSQYDSATGRLRVFKELVDDRILMSDFCDDIIRYRNEYLAPLGCNLVSIDMDPAGVAKSSLSEKNNVKSAFEIARDKRLPVQLAPTNSIVKRIDNVSTFLTRLSRGKSGLVISKKGCPTLHRGFLGYYVYESSTEINPNTGKPLSKQPKKNYYSHVHDALQYMISRLLDNEKSDSAQDAANREMQERSQRLHRRIRHF